MIRRSTPDHKRFNTITNLHSIDRFRQLLLKIDTLHSEKKDLQGPDAVRERSVVCLRCAYQSGIKKK